MYASSIDKPYRIQYDTIWHNLTQFDTFCVINYAYNTVDRSICFVLISNHRKRIWSNNRNWTSNHINPVSLNMSITASCHKQTLFSYNYICYKQLNVMFVQLTHNDHYFLLKCAGFPLPVGGPRTSMCSVLLYTLAATSFLFKSISGAFRCFLLSIYSRILFVSYGVATGFSSYSLGSRVSI